MLPVQLEKKTNNQTGNKTLTPKYSRCCINLPFIIT